MVTVMGCLLKGWKKKKKVPWRKGAGRGSQTERPKKWGKAGVVFVVSWGTRELGQNALSSLQTEKKQPVRL